MKFSIKAPLSLALVLMAGEMTSDAATTIQFYEPYNQGIVDNLANAAGVATDGMRWGILVDTSGNGFALNGVSYDAYTSNPNTTSGFFSAGGSLSDDYFIPGQLTVDASGIYPAGDNGSTPGSGSIVDDIAVNYTNGISSGDKFALIWFSTNTSAAGDKYGFFTDASFTLPSDSGATVGYTQPFIGTDPVRPASNTFQGVPEPSRTMVLGMGLFSLAMWRGRRRKGAEYPRLG